MQNNKSEKVIIRFVIYVFLCFTQASCAAETEYKGDVTDVRVVRRVENHPGSWRIWQPYIIQGQKVVKRTDDQYNHKNC